MGPHWLTGETPASEARITLSPRVAEAGSHLNSHGRGQTLPPPRAPLGPAALPSSHPSGPTEGHSLSLCLSLCCTHEVGPLARGCEGNKGLHGDRWLEIGAESQMLGAGGSFSRPRSGGTPQPRSQCLHRASWALEPNLPDAPCRAVTERVLPTPGSHPRF